MCRRKRFWLVMGFFINVLLIAFAQAQSPGNFYEGKTITFFAGSSAGGGTDLTARLIAKHVERYIPGKPTVLVVNKPGAGGMIGLDFQVIPGYPGTAQILLDIERGALDGRSQGTGSLLSTRREWIEKRYIRLLVTSKNKRDPRLPAVPTIEELAPAGKKNLLSALYAAENIGRSVVLPPGVSPERVKILRDAFAEMTQDPQFLKEAEKIGLEIGLTRGEDMNRDIESTVRDKELMAVYKMIMTASEYGDLDPTAVFF
jgi:tripartite-type tricarboxylate transporter receptor subunit TctC